MSYTASSRAPATFWDDVEQEYPRQHGLPLFAGKKNDAHRPHRRSPVRNRRRPEDRGCHHHAADLLDLQRYEEAKSLLRKTVSVARRVLGENNELTLRLRSNYAEAL